MCSQRLSIKTRIKTGKKSSFFIFLGLTRRDYPLKQGLRQDHDNWELYKTPTRRDYPLKQGLRPFDLVLPISLWELAETIH